MYSNDYVKGLIMLLLTDKAKKEIKIAYGQIILTSKPASPILIIYLRNLILTYVANLAPIGREWDFFLRAISHKGILCNLIRSRIT